MAFFELPAEISTTNLHWLR